MNHYPKSIQPIWKIVRVVQSTWGFVVGLTLFTQGPYLYDRFGGAIDPAQAMLLTSIWLTTGIALQGLLEVPTGAIGDAIGRKRTVLWSFLGRTAYLLVLALTALAPNVITAFCLAMIADIIFAFCYTLFSGTFTAWCVDSLRQKAPEIGYEHMLSRGYMYQFIAQLAGCIIGVACYAYDMAHVAFLLGAFVYIPCFTYCSSEMEEAQHAFLPQAARFADITKRVGEIIGLGLTTFRRSTPILCLTLLFASYLFLANLVDCYWPLALKPQVPSYLYTPIWMALGAVAIAICAFGSRLVNFMSRSWASRTKDLKTHNAILRQWLVIGALSCSLPILAMGFLRMVNGHSLPLFIVSMILVQFAYGMMLPCYETLVNNYIPDASANERATILSYSSMVRCIILTLLGIPAAGQSTDATAIGWMIPATLLTLVAITTWIVLRADERRGVRPIQLVKGNAQ